MDFFLTYRTELPDGLGWSHFGTVHLVALALLLVTTLILVRVYRRLDASGRRHFRVVFACLVLGLEALKQIACLVSLGPSAYPWEELPLHLCGLSVFIIAVHAFWPNRTTATLLYSLTLLGAVMALAFADWNVYPVYSFFNLQPFLSHGAELIFPILLLSTGEIRPRLRDLWRSVVFLVVVVVPVYFLNLALDTNFFFVNAAAPDSPLSFLMALFGNPGYLVGYAGMLLIIWMLMYLPWIIADRRRASALP
jgi:hypothetical integral membrane protein (TIGR02206 family)